MTEMETIKIMEVLGAFYAGGKNDPQQQAFAWRYALRNCNFNAALSAVFRFAENDTRDYASFPTPGKIIAEIKAEEARNNAIIKEVIRGVGYGRDYRELSESAKVLIPEKSYNKWLNIKADEFAEQQDKFASFLKNRQLQLGAGEQLYIDHTSEYPMDETEVMKQR